MNFHVGQKVVCVDDAPRGSEGCRRDGIFEGEIYTIRVIEFCPFRKEFGVSLNEVTAPIHPYYGTECLFRATRFRPLVERKTSIELLTSIRPDTPIVGPEIERERFKQKELA